MRMFILFGLMVGAPVSWAGTQVMFAKNGSKATVLMLAATTNPDAVGFNDKLALPDEDANGKLTRKFAFNDDGGANTIDLACAFSKVVPGTGSCFVVFYNLGGVKLNPGAGQIEYRLSGSEAARLLAIFKYQPGQSVIFESSDGKFRVSHAEAGSGTLELTYGL